MSIPDSSLRILLQKIKYVNKYVTKVCLKNRDTLLLHNKATVSFQQTLQISRIPCTSLTNSL